MSVLIPQECTSEMYMTVMTTDTQQDKPGPSQAVLWLLLLLLLFVIINEKLQTYQHVFSFITLLDKDLTL